MGKEKNELKQKSMTRHFLVPWESTWGPCVQALIRTLRVLPLPVSRSDAKTAPQQSPLPDLTHIYLGFSCPLMCCLKVLEVGIDPLPGMGLGAGQEKANVVVDGSLPSPGASVPTPQAPPCLMHHQTHPILSRLPCAFLPTLLSLSPA